MKQAIRNAVLLFIWLILLSCQSNTKDAIGQYDVVMTMCSEEIYNRYLPQLKDIFEKKLLTPQTENEYTIIQGAWKNFESYKRWRTVLMIGILNDDSPTSHLVIRSLKPEAMKLVQINQAFVFQMENVWAKNQTVFFLAAKNDSILEENLHVYGERLFQLLDESVKTKTAQWLYKARERIGVEKKLEKMYRFSLRIPELYQLSQEKSDSNLIWITTSAPDRWILITWSDVPTGKTITVNAHDAVIYRDSMAENIYQKDRINPKYTSAKLTQINGMPTIRLQGLWENDSLMVGGPFINYQLFDRNTRRYYMIDGAMFAAGLEKNMYLKQMDIIMRTFTTFPKP